MGKQQKTFEYPDRLIEAQRALAAVQAERRAHLADLPAWHGDLEAARAGLGDEALAESACLEEAERQAAHRVWADEFWAGLSGEDRVAAAAGSSTSVSRWNPRARSPSPASHRCRSLQGRALGGPSTSWQERFGEPEQRVPGGRFRRSG
ncbi:hypothetical protein ABT093_30365 [Kitasatospora sp. NPDC002551]|uniref:hypothetical protein n=1 Tax=Kitasatospora sp. NPDC002551 TaxID=3154539 RepID=UPI0033206882